MPINWEKAKQSAKVYDNQQATTAKKTSGSLPSAQKQTKPLTTPLDFRAAEQKNIAQNKPKPDTKLGALSMQSFRAADKKNLADNPTLQPSTLPGVGISFLPDTSLAQNNDKTTKTNVALSNASKNAGNLPTFQRVLAAADSGAESAIGGSINAVQTVRDLLREKIVSLSPEWNTPEGMDTLKKAAQQGAFGPGGALSEMYLGDKFMKSAQTKGAAATEGTSGAGKFALEGISSITNMATGALTAGLTGIPFAAQMGVQVGGSSAYDAKQQGKTLDQQFNYGLSTGIVAGITEGLGGIGASKVIKATTGKAVSSLLAKLPTTISGWLNSAGAKIGGKIIGDAISEVGEESLQYSADIVLQKLILNNDVPFDIKQMAYQALQGGVIGGLFGGATGAANVMNNPQSVQNPTLNGDSTITNNTTTPQDAPQSTIAPTPSGISAEQTNAPQTNVEAQYATQSKNSPIEVIPPHGPQLRDVSGVDASTKEFDISIANPYNEIKSLVDKKISESKSGHANFSGILDAISNYSSDKANVGDYVDAYENIFNSGEYGINAKNEVYVVKPNEHIDNRDMADMKNPNIKSFQYQHPKLHKYYVEAANYMLHDLYNTTRGEKGAAQVGDYGADSKAASTGGYIWWGTKRDTTKAIAYLKDSLKMTYNDIDVALQNIIEDNGQENYARAKRVEIMLDDMLTNGYTNIERLYVPPNAEYVQEKQKIAGASIETESTEPPAPDPIFDDLGAAKSGLYQTNQWSSDTKYPINENRTPDLDNLPVEDSQPNFDKPKQEGGFLKKWRAFYTHVVDTQHPLSIFSKIAKDDTAMLASNARNANGIVDNILNRELTDAAGNTIGKSFYNLVKQIPKDKMKSFWLYMMHRHNENRSVMDNNLIPNFNKAMSVKKYTEMEQANPEFKALGDEVVAWIDTFETEWGVKSGLIKQDIYHNLRIMYPNYFPTQRIFDDIEKANGFSSIGQKYVDNASVIKKAKGSERDLNPLENIANLVNTTVKAAVNNRVGQAMYDAVKANPTKLQEYAEIVAEPSDKANVVSVWKDGEKVYLKINNKELLDSLNGIPKATRALPGLSQATNLYKGLITQYNPLFGIKNFARDLPTGYAYGSEANPFKYLAGEVKAIKDILTNGTNYKRYRGVGGGMSNYFTKDSISKFSYGLTKQQGTVKKVASKIGDTFTAFNNAIETATRLNEFNTVFAKTGDVQKALDASNNVTVNFARGGDITKTLDKNGVAYLNASVQGLDKFIRSFSTPRAAVMMIAKSGLAVTLPTLAFYLLNMGNPHYEDEDDRTKDTYYLIPNYSGPVDDDGNAETFIKIPKSRELGVLFGALFERILRAANGESASTAFKGFGTSLATNFKPVDPTTSTIFSPATLNLFANKDFAGRTIVSPTLQKLSPHLQYDEKTSELTKFIADIANKAVGAEWSPKVMDYLIDSYTGVVGDFLLPATTKGSGGVASPVVRAFITDSTYSNQALTNFYDNMDKAATAAADKNLTENIDSEVVTLEEKISNAYVKANAEMSVLSKISARVGVGALTADDIKVLKEYGFYIDTSELNPAEIQRQIKKVQVEIAKDTIALANSKSEMALDLNNDSGIAKSVDKYASSGISKEQAYALKQSLAALEKSNGKYTDLTDYDRFVEMNKLQISAEQKAKLVATLYTTHDEQTGAIKAESLLPYLSNTDRLLSVYKDTKESEVVSMTIPEKFTLEKVVYELSDSEKKTFKSAYVKLFNQYIKPTSSLEEIKKIKEQALKAAKYAVYQKRNEGG